MFARNNLPTQTPVSSPPPGPTYVRVEPVELAFRLFVVSVIIASFVLITIGLRILSRFYTALKLGWDEVFVSTASFFSILQTALFGMLVYGGLGHHSNVVPAPNQFTIPRVLFIFELFHIVSLNFAKLSALFLYMRLFSSGGIVNNIRWSILAVSLATVGLVLWQFLFCHPLYKMFQWGGLQNCGRRQPLYLAVCIWSIATDLLLVAIPLSVIWSLKMDRTRKVRLSVVFTAGLVVTVTSIVRLAYIITINYHSDFSIHSVLSTFLAVLEPPETIFCVSLPMIVSLFTRLRAQSQNRPHKMLRAGMNTHVYNTNAGRAGPQGVNFDPLETNNLDVVELNEVGNPQMQVLVSGDTDGPQPSSSAGVAEAIDEAMEEPLFEHHMSGALGVSKNVTVTVTKVQ